MKKTGDFLHNLWLVPYTRVTRAPVDYLSCFFLSLQGLFLQTQIQPCRSQRIQAPLSSTPSSYKLLWQTPLLSTCACWISTLSRLWLATLASSAQLVRRITKAHWFVLIMCTIWLFSSCICIEKETRPWCKNVIILGPCLTVFINCLRTCHPICGDGQGNDQGWDEHCKNELLPWHTWSEWRVRNTFCQPQFLICFTLNVLTC